GARELIGADSVLAVGDGPKRRKPLLQADGTILEDRPNLDAELLLTLPALPDAPRLQKPNGRARTVWARSAVRPAETGHEIERHILVREVDDRLQERLGYHGFSVHTSKITSKVRCVKYIITGAPGCKVGLSWRRRWSTGSRNSVPSGN